MIDEIKKQLLNNPEYIKNILEYYGFCHIDIKSQEIRCGRDKDGNKTAIRIKLQNNDYLYVRDYVTGLYCDLINFIIRNKDSDFIEVINIIKNEIGTENFYYYKKPEIFGGFYNKIKNKKSFIQDVKIYDKSILDRYCKAYCKQFLIDNIDFKSQKFFNIRYDIESQRIVFPIYDWEGNIIGIKGRANWEVEDDDPKYLYLYPCSISQTLYGYCHNYSFLENEIILVVESEKSVMQAYSYGFRNIVALCGNTISPQQCKLIMSLNPKQVIFALDEGLDADISKNNIERLSIYTKLKDTKVTNWNPDNSNYIEKGSKRSLTDMGQEIFMKILNEEILERK